VDDCASENGGETWEWCYCERDGDGDGDEVRDGQDNCPAVPNPDQVDGDDDGHGDACDTCPSWPDPFQVDSDDDGVGDACELVQEETEPNNSAQTCDWLAAESWVVSGEVNGDYDWYCVELSSALSYSFNIDAANGRHLPPQTNLDAILVLWLDGQQLALSDDVTGVDPAIAGRPPVSGVYQLQVASYGAGGSLGMGQAGAFYRLAVDLDGDADGIGDTWDNCPAVANIWQEDGDGDGIGDACQP